MIAADKGRDAGSIGNLGPRLCIQYIMVIWCRTLHIL